MRWTRKTGQLVKWESCCSASTISAGWRRLFLPIHPLFLTTRLDHFGAVAGDVEFQDDPVVDHPVSRAFAKRPTGRRTWSGRPATARRPRALPPASATPRLTTPAGPTVKAGPLSRPGRRPTAISTCPLHHRPPPSTSAAWRRTSRPWPPSSRPGLPSPTYTPPPTCRRMTIPPATCHSGHRLELPRGYSATLTHDGRVRNADPNNPTRSRWLETALFTAMAVNASTS